MIGKAVETVMVHGSWSLSRVKKLWNNGTPIIDLVIHLLACYTYHSGGCREFVNHQHDNTVIASNNTTNITSTLFLLPRRELLRPILLLIMKKIDLPSREILVKNIMIMTSTSTTITMMIMFSLQLVNLNWYI